MTHLLEVRVENIYPDDVYVDENWPDTMVAEYDQVKKAEQTHGKGPHIASVTLELEVHNLPTCGASDAEWDEWAHDTIFPFTGTGRTEGDAGYFAEIVDVLPPGEGYRVDHAEFAHVIGRTFEWGI